MLTTAAATLPLWTSIVLALASPAVAAFAVWIGKRTQDATLSEQRDQLTANLDHDHAMRRREEILALIADATTLGSRRMYVTDRAKDAWQRALTWDDPNTQVIERERVVVVEELRNAWGRINVRFRPGSPVQRCFDDWRDTLDAYSSQVRFCHQAGRPSVPEMFKVDELRQAAAEAAGRWLDAARAAVADLDALASPRE